MPSRSRSAPALASRTMAALPRPVHIYIALIAIATVGLAAGLLATEGLPAPYRWPLAALLAVCMLLAWLYPLPVGFKTHFYVDTAVLLATALLFEPGAAMAIAGLGTFAAQRARRRFWDETVFNTGQIMAQVALVSLIMGAAGYPPGSVAASDPGWVVAVAASGLALFAASAVLVGLIVALQGGLSPVPVWVETIFRSEDAVYAGHLAQVGIAVVGAVLGAGHYWTIALLIPPIGAVYLALDHGMELRRTAEMALRLQQRNLTEAQRLARIGSWEWDLATGAQGWSEEAFRLLGFEPPFPAPSLELLLERIHPDDRARVDGHIHAAIRFQSHYDIEHRIITERGRELTVHHRGEVIVEGPDARPRLVAMIHDVSERKQLEERLQHLAFHDPLTGLPNRARLFEELEATLSETRRGGREFALLFVDMDNFKEINDSLGHKAGDEVLSEIGRRLASSLRQGDIVARYGGDEFLILARSVARPEEAGRLAERLVDLLAEEVKLTNSQTAPVAASIGIVMPDSRLRSSTELLQLVDAALYHAKRDGKGIYTFYGPTDE